MLKNHVQNGVSLSVCQYRCWNNGQQGHLTHHGLRYRVDFEREQCMHLSLLYSFLNAIRCLLMCCVQPSTTLHMCCSQFFLPPLEFAVTGLEFEVLTVVLKRWNSSPSFSHLFKNWLAVFKAVHYLSNTYHEGPEEMSSNQSIKAILGLSTTFTVLFLASL